MRKRSFHIDEISGFCKFYGNKMIFAKYFIFFASVSFLQNLSFFSNVFRAVFVCCVRERKKKKKRGSRKRKKKDEEDKEEKEEEKEKI